MSAVVGAVAAYFAAFFFWQVGLSPALSRYQNPRVSLFIAAAVTVLAFLVSAYAFRRALPKRRPDDLR
jgi:hypothetical protein